jgi:Protein of unknown function, DUF488
MGHIWRVATAWERSTHRYPDAGGIERESSRRAYTAHTRTAEFVAALDGVVAQAGSARVVLMCAESLWWRCHRRLIADVVVLTRAHEVRGTSCRTGVCPSIVSPRAPGWSTTRWCGTARKHHPQGAGDPVTPRVAGFSSWPPNCLRIAESALSANSSKSREAKRESSAAVSTGAGTPSSIADSTLPWDHCLHHTRGCSGLL